MDRLDREILKRLQENCRISTEELGSQVGLSATACQRRLKKLRQKKIIQKEVAVLDGISAGGHVTVVVEVTLSRGGAVAIDAFREKMRAEEAVQQCYYMAGDVDFFLVVVARNMPGYEKLTRKLFLNDSNVRKFHSNVVMENVKVGLSIPLAGAA